MTSRRTGARIVLFDDLDRVLLIHERWSDAGTAWEHWLTPGGGVEPGEQLRQAAVRELYEETGLRVELPAEAREVHVQSRLWAWEGTTYDQDDHFFAARLGGPADVRPAALTEMERQTVTGARWWTAAELAASNATFEPPEIAYLVRELLAGKFGELDRPLRRAAGRILLVDPDGLVLMIRTDENGRANWVAPGGGVEAAESSAAAAVRELAEETGLRAGISDLAAPVHTERAVFRYSTYLLDQSDDYYLVAWPQRAAATSIAAVGRTELELATMTQLRWLSTAELRALPEPVWPFGLADLLDSLSRRGLGAG